MIHKKEKTHQEEKTRSRRLHNEYLKQTKANQVRSHKAAVQKAAEARRIKDVKRIGKEIFAEMGL